jgi:drug/metabolite transporter (DMT)-like permease
MKTAGLVILIIGLIMTIYTGFQFVTQEKVLDLGSVEVTKEKERDARWSPLIGVAVMAVGGVMLAVGSRRVAT